MSGDVVARAKAAQALVRDPEGTWAVRGCTEMYAVLPELVAEVERLQAALNRVREMATSYTPSPDLVESIIEELDR